MTNKPTRTERCAYAVQNRMDEKCEAIRCTGFSDSCFKYTTIDHLEQFKQLFVKDRGLQDKLKGGVE